MTDGPIVGGCQCEAVRFALAAPPLFTHACHCLVCRRRSGSAFGLSTTVLRAELSLTRGELLAKQTSPRTTVFQCAACGTTLHSASIRHPATYIVRGGTFDDAGVVTPGAHIWVKRKHPWIILPPGIHTFDEDFDIRTTWPREALERLDAAERAMAAGGGGAPT